MSFRNRSDDIGRPGGFSGTHPAWILPLVMVAALGASIWSLVSTGQMDIPTISIPFLS